MERAVYAPSAGDAKTAQASITQCELTFGLKNRGLPTCAVERNGPINATTKPISQSDFSSLQKRDKYTSLNTMRGPGRPKKPPEQRRSESLEVRLDFQEKSAFREAAAIAGLALSAWVRERLRRVAAEELAEADLPVPFRPRNGNN